MDEKVSRKGHRNRVKSVVEENGLKTLLPHQILEFILFYGIPYKDTKEIARELLATFGDFENVLRASVSDLVKIKGMTKNAALLLHSLPEIFAFYRQSRVSPKTILTPDALLSYLETLFSEKHVECFFVISLDASHKLIHTDLIAEGSFGNVRPDPKVIVEKALKHKAASVILAHNHPSSVPSPSENDIQSTNKLDSVLSAIGIKLLDHVIVGTDSAYSFYLKSLLRTDNDLSYYPCVRLPSGKINKNDAPTKQ